jgi:hypothetical protein
LQLSELVPAGPAPFTIGISTTLDRVSAIPLLTLASGIDNIAGHHVRVFLASEEALPESAAPSGTLTQSIMVKNPTLIAGSPYLGKQSGGASTTIPKFNIPASADDSKFIAGEFATEANFGLHGVVNQAWNENIARIGNEVGPSVGDQAWVTLQLAGKSANFYYSSSNPLRAAFGTAGCTAGTARILCERTDAGIEAQSIELECTIEDLYDFDATRINTSLSRKGSIIQLRWEHTQRSEGRIFYTVYNISRTYDRSTVIDGKNVIDFFNQNSGSYVPPTNSE